MQTLCVIGPGADGVVADLAARLDGRVATVERVDREATADHARYSLSVDGTWTATGDDRSVKDLLDSLAPRYDYALVAGFSRIRLPTVVIGDDEVDGDVLVRVDDAEDLDIEYIASRIEECDPYVTLESLVERVKASPKAERSGAIATFTGRVRAKDSPDDDPTTHLEFEKYEGVAERKMAAISREFEERDGVFEVRMHHRTGLIPDGEDIVFVVVLAGHRDEAFATVEDGINRLKDEVPIFKKESTTSEEFWVYDRQ